MIDVEEIKKRKQFLINEYHQGRVTKQKEEQTYYEDTFDVPMIKSPMYVSRTGTGAWLVDGPASHIVTQNPQVFITPKKVTESARESASLVNALYNYWVRYILGQSPQPFKEFVKKLLLRGEAWIHPLLNEHWERGDTKQLPILFLTPDPLNIFASPTEEHGIPEYVVVYYQRSPWQVEMKYPDWQNPNKDKTQPVDWVEYWDAESRYFAAGNEKEVIPVLKGEVQKNIYGFVPFIHAYSGFGDTSHEGKPESLAVGRLRRIKNLLLQECAINSDIDSTLHKFAHPRIDLLVPAGTEINQEELKENYDMSSGAFNVVPIGEGGRLQEGERILPTEEAFRHLYNIRLRIAQEAPPIMAGLPSGSSGRQEDIVGTHFIRRFDCIVEATEIAFAKALDMGKDILHIIPGWLPLTQWLEQPDGNKGVKKISKDDLDAVANCVVQLKAADPIEDDRKLMAGRALKAANLIDWQTFLIEYAGYTPERANDIINQTIADTVVMQNPILFQALSEKVLENLGMHEQLERLREQTKLQQKMGEGLQKPVEAGPRGGEPRQFNEQSPEAREMVDVMLSQKGVRRMAM